MGKLGEAVTAYTFDDFMLVPVHSDVRSRKDPDISMDVSGFQYKIPIVSSPMNTVTSEEMLYTMCKLGGVGVLHRYMSISDQVNICERLIARLSDVLSAGRSDPDTRNAQSSLSQDAGPGPTPQFYAAVGANGDSQERVAALVAVGVAGICVDVANGHNIHALRAVEDIKAHYPGVKIMAGNVCTYEGARDLAERGADSIRIGVGSGAVCKTRIVTGHGVPQLTAIEECASIKTLYPNVALIGDGGVRSSGDIVKSLAIGADCVMIGSLLAGTVESPGEIIEEDGKQYKFYNGMASSEGRSKWFDRTKSGLPSEGVSIKVPYVGRRAEDVIEGLCASVKVGLSYAGANNIKELRNQAKWCRITMAGQIEGTPHGKK